MKKCYVFGNFFFFKVTQKQKFKNLNKRYLNSTDFSPRGGETLANEICNFSKDKLDVQC